jgi:hypothetical protein
VDEVHGENSQNHEKDSDGEDHHTGLPPTRDVVPASLR